MYHIKNFQNKSEDTNILFIRHTFAKFCNIELQTYICSASSCLSVCACNSPSNYRPISLLPVFSKIFKKVVYKRLFDHLNSDVILSEHQYGFRSEVSTENTSYILLSEILTALNNKQMVGGIFCDLHKAFDCIIHAVLLEKMKFYEVSGKFYNVVKSYLDGRYQKVILSHNSGIESTWEKIKWGTTRINCGTHFFFF